MMAFFRTGTSTMLSLGLNSLRSVQATAVICRLPLAAARRAYASGMATSDPTRQPRSIEATRTTIAKQSPACLSFTATRSNPPHVPDSMLSSSGSSATVTEYSCPTRVLDRLSQLVILDHSPSHTLAYDCPVSSPVIDTTAPDTNRKSEISEPTSQPPVSKEAKMIMRIRHKKMKKHKLRKLRKRMYFLWRKQKLARKSRRLAEYNRELDGIRATGEEFNAEDFVKSQLEKARRGGYYINVFESQL